MNKKAEYGEILKNNAVYLILVFIFLATMFGFIWHQMNEAAVWEEFYAEEISKIINLAQPGDNITINAQKATEIAVKNEVRSRSEIFQFNNLENEICVKLSPGKKTCYYYFNNVDIINYKLKIGIVEENTLNFQISEKQK